MDPRPSSSADPARRLHRTLPVHCLSDDDLGRENSKGIFPHFHAPENRHSRYMADMTAINKGFLRDIERPAPFAHRPTPGGIGSQPSVRPATAPTTAAARSRRLANAAPGLPRNGPSDAPEAPAAGAAGTEGLSAAAAATAATIRAAHQHSTTTGVPCYSVKAALQADLLEGRPYSAEAPGCKRQPWRVAKVVTQPVSPSRYGHGEAGAKAFHQDYRYYKYFGFAGRGARTSWACNPKLAGKGGPLHGA